MTHAQRDKIRDVHLQLLVQTSKIIDEADKLKRLRDELITASTAQDNAPDDCVADREASR